MMRDRHFRGIQGIVFSHRELMVQSVVNTFGAARRGQLGGDQPEALSTRFKTRSTHRNTYTSQSVGAKLIKYFKVSGQHCVAFGFESLLRAAWLIQRAAGIYFKRTTRFRPGHAVGSRGFESSPLPVARRAHGNRLRLNPRPRQGVSPTL
jgi:hypothetical protein